MFRRIVCCLCCLLLLLLPALSPAEETFVMAGYDGEESTHTWETNEFFTRMETATGLTFTYNEYTSLTKWQAAKDEMFSSGQLPDVLFKAALTTDELNRYTQSGQLIDLLPLLPENAPHLWALLEQNPEWLEAITLPSGAVGALPSILPVATQDALWINQAWLTKLGLDVPTNMEELETVLTAFRDMDPNGNGKQDEVPLSFLGSWELKLFSHAYGVVANDYNIYLSDDGQVHYWPQEDSFFQMAAQLQDLYAKKLLDQDGFRTADVLRRSTDDDTAVRYGAFFAPTPVSLLTYAQAKDYTLVEPFVYQGKQVYRDLFGQVSRGTFAITSACKDPAALLKWVDLLYTEEGAVQAMLGNEGDAYEVDSEGYWQWKGGVENITTTRLNELSLYDTGDMPWLFPQAFYERYAEEGVRDISQALNRLNTYVKRPFPVYTLTIEQSQQMLPLQNELGRYVDQTLAQFVMGDLELSSENIAAFRQGLAQRGMDDMLAFWQTVADR